MTSIQLKLVCTDTYIKQTHRDTDEHTHTHTPQKKFTHSLTIFLLNTLEKIMLEMLNIFPKLESS